MKEKGYKNRKHLLVSIALLMAVMFCAVGYIYFNVPLRTQIYRSFCKGNWNLFAVDDTIYATGYCGIRKYLVKDGKVELLAENESFLRHRIVGNGTAVYKNRLFVACRSYLPGPDKNDKAAYEGEMVVLDRTSFQVVSEFTLPSKMNEAVVSDSILLLAGINRFYLFDISNPDFPQKLAEYKSPKYREYQGSTVWKHQGRRYAAFTLFTLGIDIWDITDATHPVFLKNLSLSDICKGNNNIQTLDMKCRFPYLYATLAPMSNVYGKKEDVRGVIRIDVSDMDSVKAKAFYIPRQDYWKPMPGDAHPKSIDIYKNRVYLSAATSGAAVFAINADGDLQYEGLKAISSGSDQIYPICVTNSDYLVSGDWNWNTIHIKKLK